VSSKPATQLMKASSAEAFFRARNGRVDHNTFAALKREVDSLANRDLNQASRLVERVEQLASLAGDALSDAFAQSSRARLLHLLGRHREASELYDVAAAAMRSFKLTTEAAVIRKQQVDALTHIGRYEEALRVAREARRILATDAVQLAQLETNVGNTYQMLDRYAKALAHYDRAQRVLAGAGDSKMRALIDMNRANVFAELDRPDEAMELLSSVARTFNRAHQYVLASHARYHVAYLEFLSGRYNASLRDYYEARERLAKLGSSRLVAWCDLEIAETLLALGAFDDALENAASAERRFNELEMPYESAKAEMTGALAAMNLGKFDQARRELTAAREVFAGSRNSTFAATVDSYLAELALRQGDTDEATTRAGQALRVFARQKLISRSAQARLLAARAAYQAGEVRKAKRLAAAVLRAVENRFAPSVIYMAHHLTGKIERDLGHAAIARKSFRLAVDVIERMRGGIAADDFKATFLSDKLEVYEDAIRACLDEGSAASIDEAFSLVEAAKSRGLADLLARYLRDRASRQRARRSAQDETRERLLKLIDELNWYSSHANLEDEKGGQRRPVFAERYSREIARCERGIAQLFRRIQSRGETIEELRRAATSAELQAALEPDETAIEYFTAGDEVSAFVVTRERIVVMRGLASRREAERTLAALRFQIEKFNYGAGYVDGYFEQLNQATNQCLGVLYRNLLAGIETSLKTGRLIVIPHGSLHYVPFHSLLNRRGYLVDQFEISYAPSATVLMLCRELTRHWKSSNRSEDVVALGLGGQDTPEVEGEIRAIGSLFPNAVKLTGPRATRDNLLRAAPSARYLHLASHGYFRRDNPMFSFLKLADSNLNFYSLLDLRLNAEMVTLSACHTGVNKVFPGDELQGLMRGFLHAGAPSLVASLWATSDDSTSKLMKRMYTEITAGASKRAALRTAQLAVKDEYGHPYYWAPFILMGNPN
jgi:CHAT domain-containing protein/predicted negative regulator of RcsB-dependent stress response